LWVGYNSTSGTPASKISVNPDEIRGGTVGGFRFEISERSDTAIAVRVN
jgi:hypothetical protein